MNAIETYPIANHQSTSKILGICDCATALWYGTVLARVDDGMIDQPLAVPAIATWDKGYPSLDALCS